MNLDLYKDIKGVNAQNYYPKFSFLKNESQLWYEKEMLNNWTEGLIDKDKKFVREFQETFHSSFWEIYLYRLFTEAKFQLDQSHQMPDFIVKAPFEFYVEAVVANVKDTGKKEDERTIEDQLSMMIPPYLQEDFYIILNEAIIRSANAIKSKYDKYCNQYVKHEWVNPDNPFIIAMSSYDQVNYGREYIYPMFALLYGLYFNADTEDFCIKDKIVKTDTGAEIPIGLFSDGKHSDISAVIFSCTITLGKLTSMAISQGVSSLNTVYNIRRNCDTNKYLLQVISIDSPEDIADGVFVFHNPHAKNKLPETLFSKIAVTQFFLEDGYLNYLGNETPIISRLNTSKVFAPLIEPIIKENLRKYNRLSFEDFYDIQESET